MGGEWLIDWKIAWWSDQAAKEQIYYEVKGDIHHRSVKGISFLKGASQEVSKRRTIIYLYCADNGPGYYAGLIFMEIY